MGDKTIDFKGSLGNCLVDKKISFTKVKHPEHSTLQATGLNINKVVVL